MLGIAMGLALEIDNVDKAFGGRRFAKALSGVALSIPRGVAYGLLGPNGAGKSTLLRIVLGLVRPDRGRVLLFGALRTTRLIRAKVGALIEAPALFPFLTAAETLNNLALASGLRRIDPRVLLQRVGLEDAAGRDVRGFSMGMRQRLGVACALLTEPELVILDEPINGLDPAGVQDMRVLVRNLVERDGVTVVLSSHLLDEVERTCDHVGILNHGMVVGEGPVEEMLGGAGIVRIETTDVEAALAALGPRARRNVGGVEIDGLRAQIPDMVRRVIEAGAPVFDARFVKRRLEDVFFSMTGRNS